MPSKTDKRAQPPSKTPGWLLNLTLLAGSVVFALLCFEVALRLLHRKTLSFDDRSFRQSMWSFKPNTYDPSYVGVPVRINNLGMRGPDTTLAKPPGTFRILGVGDSIAFGYGVADEDTFLRVLERRLNVDAAAGTRYEVLNAGNPATGLDYYAHTVETRAPELQPDMIVVCLALNDIDPELRPEIQEPAGKRSAGWYINRFLLAHSYLYNAVYVPAKSILYKLNILSLKDSEGFGFLALEQPSPKQFQARRMMDLYLGRLSLDAKGQGIPLVVVVFPIEVQLSDAARKTYAERLHLSFGPEVMQGTPQKWVEEDGQTDGFAVLDLLPALRRVPGEPFLRSRGISVDPVHPSAAGDAAAGEAIAAFLREKNLISGPR